jgi:F-type H+-transporting ATPase subunit delta
MSRLGVSYARAFVASSVDVGATELQILEDTRGLQVLAHAIGATGKAKKMISSPVLSFAEKLALVEELAKKAGLSSRSANLLRLLARKGRLDSLGDVVSSIEDVLLERQGSVRGLLVSSEALSELEEREIAQIFSQKLNKKIEFKTQVDPDVLAGVSVTVQGVTYDGTLKNQLARFKKQAVDAVASALLNTRSN